MENVLNFIGTGGAFSKQNLNNSAFYKKDDKIILFDCGETVFHQVKKLDIINSDIKKIDIIITHFHSDHVGSLGTLIFYCRFMKLNEVNVIFPNKDMIHSLLDIFGINRNMYNALTPEEINDYYLKEYKQLHGDVDSEGNIVPMLCFGYHLISNQDNFFYSGDTCTIEDIILNKFEKNEIEIMYHEVCDDGYKAHLQLEELVELIRPEMRNRVYCMHMSDNFNIDKLKQLGFKSVR